MKKFLLCLIVLLFAVPSCANASDIRLGIMSFANKDSDLSDDVAAPIGDIFFKALFKAGRGKFRVVEHERLDVIQEDLTEYEAGTAVDSETAAQIGAEAKCTHVLTGALSNLSTSSGGLSYGGLSIQIGKVRQKAKAVIDIKLVEVETGDIILMETAQAEVSKQEKGFDILGIADSGTNFDGLEESAIVKAVNMLTPKIIAALVGEEEPAQAETEQEIQASEVKTEPAPVPAIKQNTSFENKSTDPAKVVKTYGFDNTLTKRIIAMHKDAAKKNGNAAKAEAYARIFKTYDTDYLAAYNAGLAEFNMGHSGTALSWCSKALQINPRYLPARTLRKKAGGK